MQNLVNREPERPIKLEKATKVFVTVKQVTQGYR